MKKAQFVKLGFVKIYVKIILRHSSEKMRLTVIGHLFIKSLSLSTAFSSYVYINYVWFNVFPTI